jgi:hypothetical protein
MVTRKASCPKCDRLVPVKFQAEEIWAGIWPKDTVAFTQRNFVGDCPEHGQFWAPHIGNHSTGWEAAIREMFPKNLWSEMKSKLSAAEWKAFVEMRDGKRVPDAPKLCRWLSKVAGVDVDETKRKLKAFVR